MEDPQYGFLDGMRQVGGVMNRLAVVLACVGIVGCRGPGTSDPPGEPGTQSEGPGNEDFLLNRAIHGPLQGLVGRTLTPSEILANPSSWDVWESDSPEVAASRPDGGLEFLSSGSANITISRGQQSFTVQVEVAEGFASFLGRDPAGEQPNTASFRMTTSRAGLAAPEAPQVLGYDVIDLACDGSIRDGGNDRYDGMWRIHRVLNTADLNGSIYPEALPDKSSVPRWCDGSAPAMEESGPYTKTSVIQARAYSQHLAPWGRSGDAPAGSLCRLTAEPSGSFVLRNVKIPTQTEQLQLKFLERTWSTSTTTLRVTVLDSASSEPLTRSVSRTLTRSEHVPELVPAGLRLGVNGLAGKTVDIEMEIHLAPLLGAPFGHADYLFDDLQVLTDDGELLANYDCESPDRVPYGKPLFGPRTVSYPPIQMPNGVQVSRQVFASVPGVTSWARYIDQYHNPSEQPLEISVFYDGNLGSDGLGSTVRSKDGWTSVSLDSEDPSVSLTTGGYHRLDSYLDVWSAIYQLRLEPGETKSVLAFHVFESRVGSTDAVNELLESGRVIVSDLTERGLNSKFMVGVSPTLYGTVTNWHTPNLSASPLDTASLMNDSGDTSVFIFEP